jgi:hypothetical protein
MWLQITGGETNDLFKLSAMVRADGTYVGDQA